MRYNQIKFSINIAKFILWADSQGYEIWIENELDMIIKKNGVEVDAKEYTRCGTFWKLIDDRNLFEINVDDKNKYSLVISE